MRPHSLRLKGFKGIRAGLGLDEINVDLSTLSGLVSIAGPNGAGKTTLLDNMHPYRLQPFKCRKAKDYSPGSFSFYDQAFGSDAAKEFIFEVEGQKYRALVLIDADRRKQEAYLYRYEPNGGCDWRALTDGKTRTFDEAIEKLVGSPSLFFTSVFRAQGARNLSDYSRGDVMGLVSELLGVDHIREQSEKAREVAKILGEHVAADRRRLAGLAEELLVEGRLANQLVELNTVFVDTEFRKDCINADLQKARVDLAEAERRQAAFEADRARLATMEAGWRALDATLADLDSQRAKAREVTDTAIRQATTRRDTALALAETELGAIAADLGGQQERAQEARDTAIRQATTRRDTALALAETELGAIAADEERARTTRKARVDPAEAKIERARKVLANADGIRAKVEEEVQKKARAIELDCAEKGWEREVQALRAAHDREAELIRSKAAENQLLERGRTARQNQHDRVKDELARAKAAACKLDCRSCDPTMRGEGWVNEECDLLQDAVALKQRIPELRERLQALSEPTTEEREHARKIELLAGEIEVLAYDPKALQAKQEAHQRVKDELATLRKELEALAKWTVALPELEQAETTIRDSATEVSLADSTMEDDLSGIAGRRLAVNGRKMDALMAYDKESKEAEEACNLDLAQARERLHERSMTIEERKAAALNAWEEEHRNAMDAMESALDDLNARYLQTSADRARQHEEWSDLADRIRSNDTIAVDAVRSEIRSFEQQLQLCEGDLRDLHARRGALQTKQEALEAKKTEVRDTEGRIGRFDAEIARWKLLEKACGNDGIIGLEIDDSGVGISAIANQLLSECFGARFSLRFETQREKTGGGTAETFDITVFDAETGDTASITEKSGGQTVWLESALTRAIALFNAQGSGRDYQAFFGDESDGPLDPEKKQAYMAVKRKAMEIGKHTVEFFVSQDAGIRDMADHKIVLGDGQVRVES